MVADSVDPAHGHRAGLDRQHPRCRLDRRGGADGGARLRRGCSSCSWPLQASAAIARPRPMTARCSRCAALCLLRRLRPAAALALPGQRRFYRRSACPLAALARHGRWVILIGLAMIVGAASSLRVIGRLCGQGEAMAISDMTRSETRPPGCWRWSFVLLASGRRLLLTSLPAAWPEVSRAFGG